MKHTAAGDLCWRALESEGGRDHLECVCACTSGFPVDWYAALTCEQAAQGAVPPKGKLACPDTALQAAKQPLALLCFSPWHTPGSRGKTVLRVRAVPQKNNKTG